MTSVNLNTGEVRDDHGHEYIVTWEIDADDVYGPMEAALFARWAQTNPGTVATIFTVKDKQTGERWIVDTLEGTVDKIL